MAIKKRRRKPRAPHTTLIVMMAVKIDGKSRTLALSRQGKVIEGLLLDERPKAPDSGVKINFSNGEALHTALHALGVWSWGSDGAP